MTHLTLKLYQTGTLSKVPDGNVPDTILSVYRSREFSGLDTLE